MAHARPLVAQTAPFPDGNPLDWFAAEHERHREICSMMRDLAGARDVLPEPLAAVAQFLRQDMPRHLAEEEQELFPLLRKRAQPEDDVDQVLGRLCAEHGGDRARAADLERAVARCLAAREPPAQDPQFAAALASFATHELQHLALENAVVLPLARLRLTARDLANLRRRLAARRNVQAEPVG